MKKILLSMLLCIVALLSAKAQIGYQVSLLNTATGEPRANVTVNATLTITNSKNEVIYTGTQTATSNDFGVLSLTVGYADTFKNVDFSKLPFFIEVSVDGQLIGKSQILNVPVAEAAKALVPVLTMDELCNKEWTAFHMREGYPNWKITFYSDMTCKRYKVSLSDNEVSTFRYILIGNIVFLYGGSRSSGTGQYSRICCFINGSCYDIGELGY